MESYYRERLEAAIPSEAEDSEAWPVDVESYVAALKESFVPSRKDLDFKVAAATPGGLMRFLPARLRGLRKKPRYRAKRRLAPIRMSDLMRLEGRDFVQKAYLHVLGRHADLDGLATYVPKAQGKNEKLRILHALRTSSEGRSHRSTVHGLGFALWWNQEWNKGIPHRVPLKQLMEFDGSEFVDNAYWLLLGRQPDPGGFAIRLAQATSGRFGKIVVIRALCASEEGRRRRLRVPGMALAAIRYYSWYGLTRTVTQPRRLVGRLRRALIP